MREREITDESRAACWRWWRGRVVAAIDKHDATFEAVQNVFTPEIQ